MQSATIQLFPLTQHFFKVCQTPGDESALLSGQPHPFCVMMTVGGTLAADEASHIKVLEIMTV